MSDSEIPLEASTPVTGQGRMDAAWGPGIDSVASVTRPTIQNGQVFEQVYKSWTGSLNPGWMRNWAI